MFYSKFITPAGAINFLSKTIIEKLNLGQSAAVAAAAGTVSSGSLSFNRNQLKLAAACARNLRADLENRRLTLDLSSCKGQTAEELLNTAEDLNRLGTQLALLSGQIAQYFENAEDRLFNDMDQSMLYVTQKL